MALRHYKIIVGLLVLVGLLIVSAFAILGFYARNNLNDFLVESEASLLRSFKLNYQDLTATIDLEMDPLVGEPELAVDILEGFSDDVVFAGLFDYSGNLIDDFGYSAPDFLSSSLFFENLTFSSGYPKTELVVLNDKIYVQTGILLLDDNILLVVLDRFDDLLHRASKVYERDFIVYFGDEDDFTIPGDSRRIEADLIRRLFRQTINSQRPESVEISVEGNKMLMNAIAVYDSDNWDVIGFFATHITYEGWKDKHNSLLIFLWISALVSVVFAVLVLLALYKKSISHVNLKRNTRMAFGLAAYLPAIVLIASFAFFVFGDTLGEISEDIGLKRAKGWFSDADYLVEKGDRNLFAEFVDISRRTTGASFIVSDDSEVIASNLTARRISNIEIVSSHEDDGIEVGVARVNDVVHTYATQDIGEYEFTVLFEETPRENSILSIQFFSIGAILVLLVMVVVSVFVITNIESHKLIRRTLIGYGFLLPALVHLVWWAVGPMGFALFLAFRRWSIVDAAKPFVGLQNFIELFSDFKFWNAMKNTAVYSIYVPIGMFISLLLAIAVNKLGKLSIVLRVLYYLPVVTAGVATTIVWRWIFNRDFGVLNFVLSIFGIKPIAWLESPQFALISMMIIGIWSAIGSQLLIFLAGLQGIPKDFYDAAAVDGASKPRIFWKITLPLLKPTSLFVLVTSVIGSFQVFTPIYVLTQGGPLRSTDVVFYHIWQSAWVDMRMGYAAAQSWILFLLLAALTLVEFKLFGKESWQAYF